MDTLDKYWEDPYITLTIIPDSSIVDDFAIYTNIWQDNLTQCSLMRRWM